MATPTTAIYVEKKPTIDQCERMVTSRDKWIIAVVAGLLFVVIASPYLYRITNDLIRPLGVAILEGGLPTIQGLLIHAAVFLLLIRFLMG